MAGTPVYRSFKQLGLALRRAERKKPVPQYTVNKKGVPVKTARKINRRISRIETFGLLEIMKSEALDIAEDGKTHRFKLGWSDIKIVEAFDAKAGAPSNINPVAVGVIRREFFGLSRTPGEGNGESATARPRINRAEFTEMREQVAGLKDTIETMKDKHNRLLDRLGQRLGEGWPALKLG